MEHGKKAKTVVRGMKSDSVVGHTLSAGWSNGKNASDILSIAPIVMSKYWSFNFAVKHSYIGVDTAFTTHTHTEYK